MEDITYKEPGNCYLRKEMWLTMKSTGIVRRVDELGRVVLPIELRKTMNIEKRDPLEIFVDGDKIVLKKYEPACIFCGNAKDVAFYKDKLICQKCIREISVLSSN